ncbi:hypothetical protein [Corynebacterium sp.]|uniref:hypothetical protein n=1 Tax=Corynebacterium sp. TaxID=1720 RepID=UPI0027BA1CB6|nr:hypothetical protein [Corynebacterium sp.]
MTIIHRYAPSSSIRSPYSVATLVCAAALTLSACNSAEDDATANPQQDTTQEAQPTKNAEKQKKKQAQKLAQTYSAVLDNLDAGEYSLVHIDDSAHPTLLIREHNPGEMTTIRVHYPTDDLTSTTLLEHEFTDGAASASGSRARLLTSADHNGLLQKSWQSSSPDRKVERYVLAGGTMHKDGQEWNVNAQAIPAEYSDAAQAIIWSEVSERELINALADGHDNPMDILRSADNYPHFVAGANTSDPFAKAVHEAFIDQWVETGKNDVVVEAYSTVTGQNYSMSCDGGAVDGIVVCAGGNQASVTISDEARSEGSGGGSGSTGAGGESQSAPSQSTGAANQYTGTVRVMTGYEILALQGISPDGLHDLASDSVKVVILDNPQEVTAFAIPGARATRTAQMAGLPINWPHQDGERITLQIDSETCFWPSDVSIPRGQPRCYQH